jgi:hypothetical protein
LDQLTQPRDKKTRQRSDDVSSRTLTHNKQL